MARSLQHALSMHLLTFFNKIQRLAGTKVPLFMGSYFFCVKIQRYVLAADPQARHMLRVLIYPLLNRKCMEFEFLAQTKTNYAALTTM